MKFSMTQFQAAIVDLDGTMVDTLGDFEVALNRSLAGLDFVRSRLAALPTPLPRY